MVSGDLDFSILCRAARVRTEGGGWGNENRSNLMTVAFVVTEGNVSDV